MTAHDNRPWPALYRNQPLDHGIEFATRSTCVGPARIEVPSGVALTYLDRSPFRSDLDELGDALARGPKQGTPELSADLEAQSEPDGEGGPTGPDG